MPEHKSPQGISAEQDGRFSDKEKKLMATMKFPSNFSEKVDMKRVNLDMIEPWLMDKTTELLTIEDEVFVQYIIGLLQLEGGIDPRILQIRITPFLERNSGPFMTELWALLLDAQSNPGGIPTVLLERKKAEMRSKKVCVCFHGSVLFPSHNKVGHDGPNLFQD
jgi:serine/arginine repetitive matrix protein 1